ncbi:MAG: hypothetical protein VX185_12440 [Pseudomonadota bacterium]|nr:hypothetical protein [Pseudomonadota bacterium]
MANTIQMTNGHAFNLLGSEGSKFAKKHTALSMIMPIKGQADGVITSASHQLVFDLKKSSTFSINGCDLKLEVPEGQDHARFKLNYKESRRGADTIAVTRDCHDGNSVKRDVFKKVQLNEAGTKHLELDNSKNHTQFTAATALEYIGYKLAKAPKALQRSFSSLSRNSILSFKNAEKPVLAFGKEGTLVGNSQAVRMNANAFLSNPLQALIAETRQIAGSLNGSEVSPLDADTLAQHKEKNLADADKIKPQLIESLQYAQSWNDVTNVADVIAALHGKPTNAQDIECYAAKIFTSENEAVFAEKGLDTKGISEKIQVLGQLSLLGEAVNPAEVIRSGKEFSFDEKKQYIFPIQERAEAALSQLKFEGSQELIDAFANKNKLGTAISVLRDIAGMDAPRAFRKNKIEDGVQIADENGRFIPDQLIRCANKNAAAKGCDMDITSVTLDAFKNLKGTQQI